MMRNEDAERRYAQIEGERDYYKRLADERAAERDAAHNRIAELEEREQALAAIVMDVADLAEEDPGLREHLGEELTHRVTSPRGRSIERHILIKQAEALEHMVYKFRARMDEPDKLCIVDAEIISDYAKDLRQRAQALK